MYSLKEKYFNVQKDGINSAIPTITVDESTDKKHLKDNLKDKTIKGDCHGRMKQSHGLARTPHLPSLREGQSPTKQSQLLFYAFKRKLHTHSK